MGTRQMPRREWEKLAYEVIDTMLQVINHLCYGKHPIYGHDPIACLESYKNKHLLDVAFELMDEETVRAIIENTPREQIIYRGIPHITEREVIIIQDMPDDVYEEAEEAFNRKIDEEIDHLRKVYCPIIKKELEQAIKKKDKDLIEDLKERLEEYGCK